MSRKPKGRGRRPIPVTFDGFPPHYAPGFYVGGVTADISKIYPTDIFDKLCRDHRISEPKDVDKLRRFLGFAASTYFAFAATEEGHVPGHIVKNRFQKISKSARAMLKELAHLDADFRLAVVREVSDLEVELGRGLAPGQSVTLPTINAETLTQAVEFIELTARRYVEGFEPQAAGRRPDHALRIWLSNARAFWMGELGRPFTFDALRGREGHTPAFRFCLDALRPLAREITPPKLATAMRKAIRASS